ncbi:hypothetical protein OWM07_01885 [Deferribacter thermophilus]|uniref:hypothetical protein n=1 Tax=Deferribacter thermophilus TaxID=53573 RepID=UPI003C212816
MAANKVLEGLGNFNKEIAPMVSLNKGYQLKNEDIDTKTEVLKEGFDRSIAELKKDITELTTGNVQEYTDDKHKHVSPKGDVEHHKNDGVEQRPDDAEAERMLKEAKRKSEYSDPSDSVMP